MLALRTAPPAVTVAEAAQIARQLYGLDGAPSILSGERDRNFRIGTAAGDFVLKIIDASAGRETADCQVSVLRHLARQDPLLPVPRLHPTLGGEGAGAWQGEGGPLATLLIGFLAGQPFPHGAVAALLSSLGETLARLDRALQGFAHPGLGAALAWDVRRLPELGAFAELVDSAEARRSLAVVLDQFLPRLPALAALRSQAIHADCHESNLLTDDAGIGVAGIFDFGDMLHAPLVFEPALAMSELLTHGVAPVSALQWVLRGYALLEPLQPAEIDALYDVILARHAVTILIQAWRSRHDADGAALIEVTAARAVHSLEGLLVAGRENLTRRWREAAQSIGPHERLLHRRRRLLGSGAELFYDRPLHIVRGEDVWLYAADGRRYLDAYNNVPHVGHAHPRVVEAIQRQTGLLATHTRYLHERVLEYAEQLTARLAPQLNACIFVNSGSEANDVAWRIAQTVTGRSGALVMEYAYHGVTESAAALSPHTGPSHDPRVATLKAPPRALRATAHVSAAQLDSAMHDVELALAELNRRGHEPAAFFLDTAYTSSGICDPPPAWLAAVLARVRAAGALIVADEVQYGLGRSGSHLWGFERRGFTPDLVTLGKPIGNGFPLGAAVTDRAHIEALQGRCGFFSTFGGNAVAAAAGLAVLEVLERERLMANAHDTGGYLRRRLEVLAERHACIGEVRGAGLLLGVEILGSDGAPDRDEARHIVDRLAATHAILIGYEGPSRNVLKLRPPLTFRREHADLLVAGIAAVLNGGAAQ